MLTLDILVNIPGLIAQSLSRDLNVDIFINQSGYLPGVAKCCITKGDTRHNFEVIDLKTQKIVFSGMLIPKPGDFGNYLSGDFSSLTKQGHYYIKSDTLRSYPFRISKTVYLEPIGLIEHYFSLQRCGSSTTGYLSPCHLDDGVRLDNGKHQDVSAAGMMQAI
jgi:endoglucanase